MNKKQSNTHGAVGYQAETIYITPDHRYKSTISRVINIISTLCPVEIEKKTAVNLSAEIEYKIRHNNIVRSRYIIENIKTKTVCLDEIYETLEAEYPGRKQKVLRYISTNYQKELFSVTSNNKDNNMKVIRKNSDIIFEKIIENLKVCVINSANLKSDIEDVVNSINLIVADAFVRCLVLENPEKPNDSC